METESDDHTDADDSPMDDDDDMPEGAVTFDKDGNVTADLDKLIEWNTDQSDGFSARRLAASPTCRSCASAPSKAARHQPETRNRSK